MKLEDLTNVYFACSGNTCRSPMAQCILKHNIGGDSGIIPGSRKAIIEVPYTAPKPTNAASTYTAYVDGKKVTKTIHRNNPTSQPHKGGRISFEAEKILLNKYGDTEFVEDHSAKGFTREELLAADIIMVMDPTHRRTLMREAEAWREDGTLKVYTLGELIGDRNLEVTDPMTNALTHGGYGRAFSGGWFAWKDTDDVDQGEINDDDYWAAWDARKSSKNKTVKPKAYLPTKPKDPDALDEDYLKTFDQLEDLIKKVLELDELPLVRFQDLLEGDLISYHQGLLKSKNPKKRSGCLLNGYLNGHLASDLPAGLGYAIKTLKTVAEDYVAFADTSCNKRLIQLAGEFKSIMDDLIIPVAEEQNAKGAEEKPKWWKGSYGGSKIEFTPLVSLLSNNILSFSEVLPEVLGDCDLVAALQAKKVIGDLAIIARNTTHQDLEGKLIENIIPPQEKSLFSQEDQ